MQVFFYDEFVKKTLLHEINVKIRNKTKPYPLLVHVLNFPNKDKTTFERLKMCRIYEIFVSHQTLNLF